MITPNNFFVFAPNNIQKIDTDSGSSIFLYRWVVPESLPYFHGHFPENPILPGVAIIDASLEYLRVILNNPLLEISTVVTGKFLDIITPKLEVYLSALALSSLEGSKWNILWESRDLNLSCKKLAELTMLLS